ncbi:hypothetical protein Tco_0444787 [Tanacetum coccineum]
MANLSKDIQCASSDTRPPMLDMTDFKSWKQCIQLYCRGPERARVYSDLSPEDKDRYNADIRATNILLQGLPKDIYTLINHYTDAKDIYDNVKMLLEGSELTKEDRESQLYDDFEHFRQNKGETIHDYYGRFVTVVKLNKGLRDSNYDQLYAYLKQHEALANENKMMLERFTQPNVDPLALMSNVSHQSGEQCKVQLVMGELRTELGMQIQVKQSRLSVTTAMENGVTLDEEKLLFIAGGQDNDVDEDVDEQPVQDLALNVDNVFQADDCDAFDSDVYEAPTAQTMFMANLLSADPVYDEVSPSYDSDILSEVPDHDNYQDAVCEHHGVHEMRNYMDEVCSVCYFGDGDSFTYDPNPNSFNDSPKFSDYPPQLQYEPYSCELCGNDSHHGYDCPSRFPLDEFIKSSVEDLVLIPSESEDISEGDSDCDLPSCDDFSPINVYEEKSVTFSNPLFDSNDDFTSSDDESLSDEDVPEENVKIYSNPLFEFDDEYISSDVNPLFNEVLENIESKDSYVSNLDEPVLLVTPLSDDNEDECFDPGGEIDEIDAFLVMDISTDIEDGYHDSEGDIIYFESLLLNDTIHNLPLEVFFDHEPKCLKDEPDFDNLKSMVKKFDPGIPENFFSPTYVRLPFEDRHYLSFTYVIRIFLPYFTYPVNSSLPLSSGSEDIIFDPGISAFHFSSLEPVAYECPLEVCSSTCFIPNITMILGE